jgi:hypothetical protein
MATAAAALATATRTERPASPAHGLPAIPVTPAWSRAQAINSARHAAALRPFSRSEFGNGPESPSEGHISAVNALVSKLRDRLLELSKSLSNVVNVVTGDASTANLQRMLELKEHSNSQVRIIEKVWDFYFELFGQRQSRFGCWLLGCDRIALDCYQTVFMNLGGPKSIPAPPPFSYMRTGFSPATFRRGISLTALGKQINPFPLVQLPYHRLVNPWTLGATLHEVSHNLQNELGLAEAVPKAIAHALLKQRLPREVAAVWAKWNREIYADLSGLLLGGPAVITSLMDVVARSPESVASFNPSGVHPTPYLRVLLSVELLRRMGFPGDAKAFERVWRRMYPKPSEGTIPRTMLATAPEAMRIVVDAICYRPYEALGGKPLAQVIRFDENHQHMIDEAARRMAKGNDPGVVPERFLIGAARLALDHKLARPGAITDNFYRELSRR